MGPLTCPNLKTNIKPRHDVIYVDNLGLLYSRDVFVYPVVCPVTITANHVKECHMSASIKDWSHSQIFRLAFTITASISLGDNIFPSHRSLTFRIDIYAMYFRLPTVGRLFSPTFAENDNLITSSFHGKVKCCE